MTSHNKFILFLLSCSLLTSGISSSIPRLPMAPAAPAREPSAPRPPLALDDAAPRRPRPLLPARPGLGATPAPGSASRSPPHPVLRQHPTQATSHPGPGAAPKALAPPSIGWLRCHSCTQANESEARAYGQMSLPPGDLLSDSLDERTVAIVLEANSGGKRVIQARRRCFGKRHFGPAY